MNLILLKEHQFLNSTSALLETRQSNHAANILNVKVGDTLDVGLINGNMGHGMVSKIEEESTARQIDSRITLNNIQLDIPPPPVLPVTLILALPRPQMIKRILQTVACMGIEKLYLLHSEKVEKSFWQSPTVKDKAIQEQLILGLEQGKATQPPSVKKYQTFKAYTKEHNDIRALGSTMPKTHDKSLKIIAHPGDYEACPMLSKEQKTQLVIGPEGGFTPQEVEIFQSQNFVPVHLGKRILKVETAVTAILSRFI